jgi:hypothetical protein
LAVADERFDFICLTVDVEWAHPDVLADLLGPINARGLKATFFCTHAGIEVPGHERALHPNFLRSGETMRCLGAAAAEMSDVDIYRHVIETTKEFCPEAVGVRGHRQFFDSTLLPIYQQYGIEYDASLLLPLAKGLRPALKPHDVLELPTYYIDHSDLSAGYTNFDVRALGLDWPGLKVFDFHPNTVFINASSIAHYDASKAHYRDPQKLLAMRQQGPGARTLFIELLDSIAEKERPTATLAEVNRLWRAAAIPRRSRD